MVRKEERRKGRSKQFLSFEGKISCIGWIACILALCVSLDHMKFTCCILHMGPMSYVSNYSP